MVLKHSQFRPVSSVYGKIEVVLMVLPKLSTQTDAKLVKDYLKPIFEALGDRVSFWVLSDYKEKEIRDAFRQKDLDQGIESVWLEDRFQLVMIDAEQNRILDDSKKCTCSVDNMDDFYPYPQDPFIVLNRDHDGQAVLLESMLFRRKSDQWIAEQLSGKTDILLRSTRYWLEGGNILVGDDYILCGRNILLENKKLFWDRSESERQEEKSGRDAGKADEPSDELENFQSQLSEAFRRIFGVRFVVWVGTETQPEWNHLDFSSNPGAQPFYHLDLFLTLGGKSKLENTQGDEVIFLASINLDKDLLGEPGPEALAELKQLKQLLDDTEVQLEEAHKKEATPPMRIIRIPLGLEVLSGNQADQDQKQKVNIYSYNNCLIEWYFDIKRVYLPEYPDFEKRQFLHQQALDKKRREKYCLPYECRHTVAIRNRVKSFFLSRGFRVIDVKFDLEEDVKTEVASLHCRVKVLKRSNY